MRVALSLIFIVTVICMINVYASLHGSETLFHVVTLFSYFLCVLTIAGVVSVCKLRSTWIAFISCSGLFLLLAIFKVESLARVMQLPVQFVDSTGFLPPTDNNLTFNPAERLQVAFETCSPLLAGIAAAFMALIFFPGQRQRPPDNSTSYRAFQDSVEAKHLGKLSR